MALSAKWISDEQSPPDCGGGDCSHQRKPEKFFVVNKSLVLAFMICDGK